mmetsp:Transcript_26780/g.107299  ORF Transcript_26780/g.107299 Transcript_26780/m.107299 type:complete len:113 (-) Transcript_26780:326-664(-)
MPPGAETDAGRHLSVRPHVGVVSFRCLPPERRTKDPDCRARRVRSDHGSLVGSTYPVSQVPRVLLYRPRDYIYYDRVTLGGRTGVLRPLDLVAAARALLARSHRRFAYTVEM